jgi:hypothetical protein
MINPIYGKVQVNPVGSDAYPVKAKGRRIAVE